MRRWHGSRQKLLRRMVARLPVVESLESRQMLAGGPTISEFMAINNLTLQDEDGEFPDWLEVHNSLASPFDIDGWYLTDDANELTKWQFPAITLPADGYLVVFASSKDRAFPLSELHANFRLTGGGEYVALVEADGTSVAWEYAPSFPQQFADVSYGLSADETAIGFFPVPTPGSANVHDPIGDPTRNIVINEIMYHPSSEDILEEYIELFHAGISQVNLNGWQFIDGVDFTLPNVTLLPGDYLVIASDVPAFSAKYPGVTNVVGGWLGQLSNRSEAIELVDDIGLRIDWVDYADEGDWSVRAEGPDDAGHRGWIWQDDHDGDGKSLELIHPEVSNEYGQNWGASVPDQGTPGTVNSIVVADIAPLILDLVQSPIIPRTTDPVTVTVRLIDEFLSGASANVHWRVDGAVTFNTVPLIDSGRHGDGDAGDGVYGAVLPPQPDGTVVEYYLESSDTAGHTHTWPSATQPSGQQLTNLLYQVNDTYDPDFPWTPGSQPVHYLIMTEAERAELADIGDDVDAATEAASNAQMNATFIQVDGAGARTRNNVGIRNRGNNTRVASGNFRNNYRVNFVSDRPFRGATALNFNARDIPDQVLGSAIHRLAGNAAGDAQAVQVRVNGQDLAFTGAAMYGSYVAIEVLDSDFVDHHFPTDGNGNLYRVKDRNIVSGGELSYEGTNPDSYRDTYFKQTNEAADDWSDLIHLTDVLNNAPDSTFLTDVSQVIDIDQWIRYIALDSLLGNLEGGLPSGRGDDFAMYRGVSDTRFVLIPHDLDTLFTDGIVDRDIFEGYSDVIGLTRLLTHSDTQPLYYQAFRDLIDTVYNPETLNPLIDQALGDFVPITAINSTKQFIVDRIANVLSQLPSQPPPSQFSVTSALPVVGEFHRTTIAAAELNGTSDPAVTQSVLVDGELANFDAQTGDWSIGSVVTGQFDTLVATGSTWDFLDNGTNQGTTWRDSGFMIDANWGSGPAQLGYGDGDEATPVGFGPSSTNKFITTYFRHTFQVTDPSQYTTATLRLQRDDGAAVYVNGTEVVRHNLLAGANYLSTATARVNLPEENTLFSFAVDPGLLVQGTNVVAVEIHQFSPDSSDISFDLELVAEGPSGGTEIPVNPGVNRVMVQAFDEPAGAGQIVDSGFLDIWYDDSTELQFSGTLFDPSGIQTWTAAAGPFHITGDTTIPVGLRLVIEPGTSVYFDQDAELVIQGVLDAQGTPFDRIRFTSVPNAPLVPDQPSGNPGLPDGPPRWDGIHFVDTMSSDNIISFADIDYAQDNGGSIGIVRSEAMIENVSWRGTHLRMVYADSASLIVQNSIFPDMFADNESPSALRLDNISEHVKSVGTIPAGGDFIIRNNVFGTNRGHNDVIDADSNLRPDPIVQILNNVFMGAGDELLDLGGDVYVAGNLFTNVFKDDETSDIGYASGISTGDAGVDTTITVARNIFLDVDHAINLRQNTATIFENNTVVKVHDDFIDVFGNPNVGSAINLFVDEPGATSGKGAYVSGNIFWDAPRVFGNADLPADTTSELQLHNNFIDPELGSSSVGNRPGTILELGVANILGNPQFVNEWVSDYTLGSESAARGSGPLGQDHGALVPTGAWITGEPPAVTGQTDATLTVGGPGIFAYRWRANGSPWSADLPIGNGFDPGGTVRTSDIVLTGLSDGMYTVEVQGQDFAGVWQTDTTASKTWTVDTTLPRLVINELLAENEGVVDHFGTQPDLIELHNSGGAAIDLLGMSISDDSSDPTKYVFNSSLVLQAGDYLILYADDASTPGTHLRFSLCRTGEGVFLHDTQAAGGALLDSVEFGVQLPDWSIGRIGHDEAWVLTVPTFGAANVAQPVGDPHTLKINEWLARGDALLNNDFLELYNPTPLPVPLGGLFLSDEPGGDPGQHPIAPLSFVAASGYLAFVADGDVNAGLDHLAFRLSSEQEILRLSDASLNAIDTVIYYSQTSDVSQGRNPNGDVTYEFFRLPTPGAANESVITIVEEVITIDDVWAFDDAGNDLGTAWREPEFIDTTWQSGPGVLGLDVDALPAPINSPVTLGEITYYFRKHFNLSTDPAETLVQMNTLIDDGAIVYVNGSEVLRVGMAPSDPNYLTLANRVIGVATFEGPFTIPSSALVQGDNVIAVEVHQHGMTSSDIVMGLTMDAFATVPDPATAAAQALLDGLRITEIMYNPFYPDPLEFVEIQNMGNSTLDLTGVRFADGIDFTFPAMTLDPGQYVVVVQDLTSFQAEYGTGANVAGQYGPSGNQIQLNDAGETIRLEDFLGRTIQEFTYDDQGEWPGRADGNGSSLDVIDTGGDYSHPDNWRSSTEFGGSPGTAGSGPIVDVVINEVFTHTDLPDLDGIELYNTTNSTIDLANWYISDSNNNYFKFQITGGSTTIGGGQYVIFDESQLGFVFKGQESDDAWLLEADATGKPIRFADRVKFGAAETGVSWGRWANGVGDVFPMTSVTLGAANSGPVGGMVVMSEVNYHPAPPAGGLTIIEDELEFIELRNTTGSPIDMSNWRLNKAVDFTFAADTTIPAGGVLVVVPFDPVAEPAKAGEFRTVYGIDVGVPLVGAYTGVLNNNGAKIELERPEDVLQIGLGYVLVDRLQYDNDTPWPTAADGTGPSLHRSGMNSYGDFATSWIGSAPTPGSAQAALPGDMDLDGDADFDDIIPFVLGLQDAMAYEAAYGVPASLNGDTDQDGDLDFDDILPFVAILSGDAPLAGALSAEANGEAIDYETTGVDDSDPWFVAANTDLFPAGKGRARSAMAEALDERHSGLPLSAQNEHHVKQLAEQHVPEDKRGWTDLVDRALQEESAWQVLFKQASSSTSSRLELNG